MSQQGSTTQVAPGSQFDVPGIPGGETEWFDQYEDTYQLAVTFNSANQTQVNGISKFRQTDIVLDWVMELQVTQTYTTGAGQTAVASPYAPWNAIGPVQLPVQNQYNSVNVQSGIDLYIFNLIRPFQFRGEYGVLGANPFGSSIGGGTAGIGYLYGGNGNAGNNNTSSLPTTSNTSNTGNSAQWSISSGSALTYTMFLRIPAAQWFDVYWDRAITGEPSGVPPHSAPVSPQYMAGTTRNITPIVKLNAGFSSTLDNGPVNTTALTSPTTDTASTFTGTGNLTFRREGVFAGNPASSPIEYPWQYQWVTNQYGVGNQSQFTVDIPNTTGQILSWYLRFFDPGANAGLGAPVELSTMSTIDFQYGSGLHRFIGTAQELQRVWLQKHNVLLPPGVIAYDLALTEQGLISNARVLNTLTTAGIRVIVTFSSNPSASSYAVLGTESLVYVT